jgi:anti-sigma factor RsiW
VSGLDDIVIMRYVDGELDETEAAEVRRLVAADPEARARETIFRESRDLVRAALGGTEEPPAATPPSAPTPSALSSAPNVAPPSEKPVQLPVRPRRTTFRKLLPLAASIAIFAVGGAAGFALRGSPPDDGGPPARSLTDIAQSYRVFATDGPRTVELGPDQRALIERWFSRRLSHAVALPDLAKHVLSFGGGRLMALDDVPAALAVYYTAEKKPIGLCISAWACDPFMPAVAERGAARMVSWTSEGYLHVLIGEVDPAVLLGLLADASHVLAQRPPAANKL